METPLIYKAITNVMADIGAVGKNSKNLQQNFMFRGIDAVMNAINPALIKHKVFIVPEILEQTREERTTNRGANLIYSVCKIKYTFYAEDGSCIECVVIGEGMDSGDKATNKAMSIAFKYACFQTFCIPTEEMIDPDAESHEVKGKKHTSKVKMEPQNEASASVPAPEFIGDKEINNLQSLFEEKDVDIAYVCSLYKVKALKELTAAKYVNIIKHIDDIKQKQEEEKK